MPLATPDIYGQIVTLYDIEQAILAQLQLWLPDTLPEVERQAGLPPQTIPLPPDADNSYRGGIDFDTFDPAWSPAIVVTIEPEGEPERQYSNGTYLQIYAIEIAVNIQADDEDTARHYAQWYGTAVALALVQHGSLGKWPNGDSVALKTILTGHPRLEFPDPENLGRRFVRTILQLHAAVDNIMTEAAGPATPAQVPYAPPGTWPEVAPNGVVTTINAEPLS